MGKKIFFYLLGIFIACMGVTFILKSNAGAGPQDIVLLVLTEKIGFTFGTWVIISQGVFLLFNSLLLKRRPEFESVITMIIWGIIMDFWMEMIFTNLNLWLDSPLLRWTCFLLGVLLIGIGVGIYLTPNLPRMPYDGMMVALCERFKLSLMVSRTILEVTFVIIGVIIGGKVGVGSLVLVLCIGTIIQFFNKLSMKAYNFNIIK